MTSCDLAITNALGLHARAAAKFVHTAGRFASHIRVGRGGREEQEAIDALCALVRRGFDETSLSGAHDTCS